MESEIWPNIIKQLHKNNLNFTIFNARMSKKSFFWWKKFNFASRHLFYKFSSCITQDEISKKKFKELGVKYVKYGGNVKFLSSKLSLKKNSLLFLKKKLKKRIIITFFSTHKDEEILLIKCFRLLNKEFSNLFFIIIPRHLKNTKEIKKNLEKNKICFGVRSLKQNLNINNKFYIADTFGELGLFFELSTISIVGGSFSKKGGHNPIEASHFNCAVIFGPNMNNFQEIKEKILQTESGFQVNDYLQLAETITILLKNNDLLKKTTRNFKKLRLDEARKVKALIKNECDKI